MPESWRGWAVARSPAAGVAKSKPARDLSGAFLRDRPQAFVFAR